MRIIRLLYKIEKKTKYIAYRQERFIYQKIWPLDSLNWYNHVYFWCAVSNTQIMADFVISLQYVLIFTL